MEWWTRAGRTALALVAVEAVVLRGAGGRPPAVIDLVGAVVLWGGLLGGVAWLGRQRPVLATGVARVLLFGLGVAWLLPLYLEVEMGPWLALPPTCLLLFAVARFVHLTDAACPGLPARGPTSVVAISAALVILYFAVLEKAPPDVGTVVGLVGAAGAVALGGWGGLLLPLAFWPAPAEAPLSGGAASGPDVIIVTVDTLRADAAASLRALDPLRQHAVQLEGQSTSSWTVPALASLHTGLEPGAHGAGRSAKGFHVLGPEAHTLAERLKARGYVTAATIENPFAGEHFGLLQGFDRIRSRDWTPGAFPRTPSATRPRLLEATLLARLGVLEPLAVETDQATEDVRDFVADSGGRPMFLWVHLFEPHLPYRNADQLPGATWLERLELMHLQQTAMDLQRIPLYRRGYDNEIEVLDRRLEGLLAALPRSPRGRILVFTADHGEELGDHGGYEHGHSMYQELLAVPLLIEGVDRLQPQVASLIDVVPTVLAALGSPADDVHGRDLARTAPTAVRSSGTLYGDPTLRAVRDQDHKLIVGAEGGRGFDLRADPTEQRPLPPSPELAERLPPPFEATGGVRELSGEERAQLEALGYIEY